MGITSCMGGVCLEDLTDRTQVSGCGNTESLNILLKYILWHPSITVFQQFFIFSSFDSSLHSYPKKESRSGVLLPLGAGVDWPLQPLELLLVGQWPFVPSFPEAYMIWGWQWPVCPGQCPDLGKHSQPAQPDRSAQGQCFVCSRCLAKGRQCSAHLGVAWLRRWHLSQGRKCPACLRSMQPRRQNLAQGRWRTAT